MLKTEEKRRRKKGIVTKTVFYSDLTIYIFFFPGKKNKIKAFFEKSKNTMQCVLATTVYFCAKPQKKKIDCKHRLGKFSRRISHPKKNKLRIGKHYTIERVCPYYLPYAGFFSFFFSQNIYWENSMYTFRSYIQYRPDTDRRGRTLKISDRHFAKGAKRGDTYPD